ncbi:hypothetical protein BKA83DRAFT_4121004 [Pisolithus microcarpus]|nr:hypothetical protein BKA83DRAFT_4121004 [Pisolithus microcarpus]
MVLDGMELLDISHASGDQELTKGLLGDIWKRSELTGEAGKKMADCFQHFPGGQGEASGLFVQLGAMVEAYMTWSLNQGGVGGKGFFDSDGQHTWEEQQRGCDGVGTKLLSVLVLDVFCTAVKPA